MKISIKQNYKSITSPSEYELPKFSVLTGKNGSGKTHVLEAISNKKISEVLLEDKIAEHIMYIRFNGLNPNINEMCDPNQITRFIKDTWSNYNRTKTLASKPSVERTIMNLKGDNLKNYFRKTLEESGNSHDKLTEDDFLIVLIFPIWGNKIFLLLNSQ